MRSDISVNYRLEVLSLDIIVMTNGFLNNYHVKSVLQTCKENRSNFIQVCLVFDIMWYPVPPSPRFLYLFLDSDGCHWGTVDHPSFYATRAQATLLHATRAHAM